MLMLKLFQRPWVVFVIGFLAGVAFFVFTSTKMVQQQALFSYLPTADYQQNAEAEEDQLYPHDYVSKGNASIKPMAINPDHKGHHEGEDALAKRMAQEVRVFAMILTKASWKEQKAVHVKATWAKRFNGFIFISSENDSSLPSIKAVAEENRSELWNKTRSGVLYVYNNILNEYDFFMKADDDTYVIVENLRFFLASKDPKVPSIMGRRFKKYAKQGYLSGGAGYVMSRAAVKLIAEGMLANLHECRARGGSEDVNLGMCAEQVGVKLVDSLDEHGMECFHPFPPASMIDEGLRNLTWFVQYNHHEIVTGLNCCSDHSVSFHYVSPTEQYVLEYLIYHLYPYGITRDLTQFRKLQHDAV